MRTSDSADSSLARPYFGAIGFGMHSLISCDNPSLDSNASESDPATDNASPDDFPA
jgi:hypothetical protein